MLFYRVVLLAVGVSTLCSPATAADFTPVRQFPSSWGTIQVFVDQLPDGMSTAQNKFAATHYAGTQKATAGVIDAIRQYNSNFLMLQYRLGTRDSGAQTQIIHNNTWSSDWATINAHEDWFVHDGQGNRVYQDYDGTIREYVMDVSGLISGNTTAGWKEYWTATTLADIAASHGDGVFADSTHLPYNIPVSLQDSHVGAAPYTNLIDDDEVFYDYAYRQYTAANKYFIPNIGQLITTSDTTTGYYTNVHGAMVEGFGYRGGTSDWKLQANRTLNLIRNDKIYIAQNDVNGVSDVTGRLWLLSNFLLLKHEKSFVNICSGSQLNWWPEYDAPLGEPLSKAVPSSVDGLRDASGLYLRRFAGGLVLVNPTGSSLTYTLHDGEVLFVMTPYGGGNIDSNGVMPAGGLSMARAGATVLVGSWAGAVLLTPVQGDANGDGIVNFTDYLALEANYGRAGRGWAGGDFNQDGQTNFADYLVLEANYGKTTAVPEVACWTTLLFGALIGLRRRRSARALQAKVQA